MQSFASNFDAYPVSKHFGSVMGRLLFARGYTIDAQRFIS